MSLIRLIILILIFSGWNGFAKDDYYDSNFKAVVASKYKLPFPKDYDRSMYKEAYKGDHKLPTGLINAIEKKGIYIDLWKAEMAIHEENPEMAEVFLDKAREQDPKNYMIYWLSAKNLMFKGLRREENETKIKGKIFDKGYGEALKCRQLKPNNYNCELHIGALLGRVMTNAGIWSALFNAGKVESAFLKANVLANSGKVQNYRYASGNTGIAISAFALGIMYRIAPHNWFLKLISPVDGDLGKSIKFHQQSLSMNPTEPESYTELGVSYLCKWIIDEDDSAKGQGIEILKKCRTLPKPRSKTSMMSYNDCKKLINKPKLACGYSKDRQQETDADKIKAQVKK